MITKREKIVQELISRLRDANPRTSLTRGFTGMEVSQFPSIFLFEGTETVVKERGKSMYRKKLPLTIEYFEKSGKPDECYAEGNAVVGALTQTIEQDTNFGKLVIGYGLTEVSLILYKENVIDVVVVYEFEYVDEFLGKGLSC